MAATLKRDVREAILVAAREAAMAYGYDGINFRDLAEAVGIKAASINYYFANKAILGEAVARRYWEDIARDLEAISTDAQSPMEALRQYPGIFRLSLERNNRMCLSSFMATEYDALPEQVLKEVQSFADINTAWLREQLVAAKLVELKALPDSYKKRQFIEAGGWATMPGQTSVDSNIAEGCSTALTT